MKWKLTDGSEGCALDFSAWWWCQDTGDPRGRDYINQRLKSETVSGKTDIRSGSISYRGIFIVRRIISTLLVGYHDIYWGTGIGIRRERVLLLLESQT